MPTSTEMPASSTTEQNNMMPSTTMTTTTTTSEATTTSMNNESCNGSNMPCNISENNNSNYEMQAETNTYNKESNGKTEGSCQKRSYSKAEMPEGECEEPATHKQIKTNEM